MIYLVEDDDSIRKLVVYALESQGYEAKGFEHPAAFWDALSQTMPELVLLDIMLPRNTPGSRLGTRRRTGKPHAGCPHPDAARKTR